MREIKFRAWDKEEKIMHSPMTLVEIIQTDDGMGWRDDFIYLQYTGLHDKSGKDIYEGDIVEGTTEEDTATGTETVKWVAEIIFDEDRLQYVAKCFDEVFELADYAPLDRVIGNIYENPELLSQ